MSGNSVYSKGFLFTTQQKLKSGPQQIQDLIRKASKIMITFNGKKRLVRNFWEPFFNGEKFAKEEIKNIKRSIRRNLCEMLFKIDRQTAENMSSSLFLKTIREFENDELQEIINKIKDIKEIYRKIGLKCDNYLEWSPNKKLFFVLQLLEVQKQLFQQINLKREEKFQYEEFGGYFGNEMDIQDPMQFNNLGSNIYQQNFERNQILQQPIQEKSQIGSNIHLYINIPAEEE